MNLRGVGATKQVPLLATYRKEDMRRDKDGRFIGAFVTVQKNQTEYFDHQREIASGKIKPETNPYLENHKVQLKDGRTIMAHDVWYGVEDIKLMDTMGHALFDHSQGCRVMSFLADIGKGRDIKTGESRNIILCPKNPILARTEEDYNKIMDFNREHVIRKDTMRPLTEQTLLQQTAVTVFAKDAAKIQRNASEKAFMRQYEDMMEERRAYNAMMSNLEANL